MVSNPLPSPPLPLPCHSSQPDWCRATTCYLVQRRIDMLPKPLTEDICSLRSNVERLAFSAIWEMTQGAQVLNVRSALFPHP